MLIPWISPCSESHLCAVWGAKRTLHMSRSYSKIPTASAGLSWWYLMAFGDFVCYTESLISGNRGTFPYGDEPWILEHPQIIHAKSLGILTYLVIWFTTVHHRTCKKSNMDDDMFLSYGCGLFLRCTWSLTCNKQMMTRKTGLAAICEGFPC